MVGRFNPPWLFRFPWSSRWVCSTSWSVGKTARMAPGASGHNFWVPIKLGGLVKGYGKCSDIWKTYWCLAGKGWEWGNGVIITSGYGSFPRFRDMENTLKNIVETWMLNYPYIVMVMLWYTSLNMFMLRDMDIYGLDIVHLRSIQG